MLFSYFTQNYLLNIDYSSCLESLRPAQLSKNRTFKKFKASRTKIPHTAALNALPPSPCWKSTSRLPFRPTTSRSAV